MSRKRKEQKGEIVAGARGKSRNTKDLKGKEAKVGGEIGNHRRSMRECRKRKAQLENEERVDGEREKCRRNKKYQQEKEHRVERGKGRRRKRKTENIKRQPEKILKEYRGNTKI